MDIDWIAGGDIFQTTCRVLVTPVNCVGVAGAGLAKQVRHRFFTANAWYEDACAAHLLVPGHTYLYRERGLTHDILFATTKDHWRDDAKLEWIESILDEIVRTYRQRRITSLAVPALGAGLGNLAWRTVQPLMAEYLSELEDVHVEVYLPRERGVRDRAVGRRGSGAGAAAAGAERGAAA